MADARERTGPLRSGHRLQTVVPMSYVRALRGISSGIEYGADVPMNLDPADGRPVEMVLDIERLAAEKPAAAWYDPGRRDLWRFGALMALQVKEERKAHYGYGANPTQSFKDRDMAMTAAQARRLGLTKLAVPTQGNAGDSLAAGLLVEVAMPDDTPMPILGNVAAAARRYPDRVELELVGPTIREAGAYLKKHYIPQGYSSVATFQEPGWRIEGKKLLGDITPPLVDAFDAGADDTTVVVAGNTINFGLNVPGGVGHFKILQIMRKSAGAAIAVSEADTATRLQRVWRDNAGGYRPKAPPAWPRFRSCSIAGC